jgi:hypothetical protein
MTEITISKANFIKIQIKSIRINYGFSMSYLEIIFQNSKNNKIIWTCLMTLKSHNKQKL